MSALDYLYGLQLFGVKLGLQRMRKLMELLNFPYRKFPAIHVAGTNGKGSTCAFISSILSESGYKVGLYTSPHLIKFNERIQVNGENISDDELEELIEEIREKLGDEETTFFEFTTAIALLYFARKEVDIVVLEVGLGGRLDATNVVLPLLCVINNISLDHTKILGDTKKEIALEKLGIVKEKVPLITSEKDKDVLEIFEKVCVERSSELMVVDNECSFQLGLEGEFQKRNAALALEVIKRLPYSISEEAIERGLLKVKWPGRLQWISEKILLDGAHNPAGMRELVDYLDRIKNKEVLVIGLSEGRDVKEMVQGVVNLFERVIVTKGNHKPVDPAIIEEVVREFNNSVEIVDNVSEAFERIKNVSGKVVVTGSLYLVGDFLKEFEKQREK